MSALEAASTAEEIITLYQLHGGEEYAGEKVSQLEHMVQAAELARVHTRDEEVVLAAFLHDIGHICVSAQITDKMWKWGIKDHEEVGAMYLMEKGFSRKVVRLVESHVAAKRYLTFKDAAYYDQLSDASKATLEEQGGRMDAEEAAAFESYPLFDLIIQMRLWDEQAKVENMELPDLAFYKRMIVKHLINHRNDKD